MQLAMSDAQGVVTYTSPVEALRPGSKWNQANQRSFLGADQGIKTNSE